MKTLQHDFTNPAQSKMLLELGVPADSANMLWDGYIDSAQRWVLDPYPRYLEYPYSVEIESGSDLYISHVLPCWSVGRLIEIFEICTGQVWQNEIIENYSKIDMLLEDFEDVEKKYRFDFSKLEE